MAKRMKKHQGFFIHYDSKIGNYYLVSKEREKKKLFKLNK